MRLLRAVAGAVLWILAAVVGLLGAILCVTVIGLPLGIPLLMGARRMFGKSVRLMLPSHIAHPVKEAKSSGKDKGRKAKDRSTKAGSKVADLAPDPGSAKKQAKQLRKSARKKVKRRKKRLNRWLP